MPGRHNRDKYNPVFLSLRKAGAAIGEYACPRPDGTIDYNSYEDALEQLEKPANPVFHKIRNLEMIDSSDRDIFSAYMATMTRRVPARKELVKGQFPLVLEEEWRRIKDELENVISKVDPSNQGRIEPVHTFKGGVGFSKPYSELTFPISARVALLGTYRKVQEGYFKVGSQLLKEINRRVIANAAAYVYSSSKEPDSYGDGKEIPHI